MLTTPRKMLSICRSLCESLCCSVCCDVFQCVHCRILHVRAMSTTPRKMPFSLYSLRMRVAVCCSVLQCVAVFLTACAPYVDNPEKDAIFLQIFCENVCCGVLHCVAVYLTACEPCVGNPEKDAIFLHITL